MVTEKELKEAIDELEEAPGSYKGCAILAALYALKDRYYGDEGDFSGSLGRENTSARFSSFSKGNNSHWDSAIGGGEDSEFLRAVTGKSWGEVLPVIDELLTAVKVLQPQLYNAFIRRF